MFKILFLISFLTFFLADSLRAIPLTIVEKEDSYDISSSVEWFVDEDAQFKANDIPEGKLQQYFNPPSKHLLNLGHMDNPVWCRFSVKNQMPEDLYLKIKNPNIDSLSIYVFNRAGDLIYFHRTGDYVPSRQREIHENNFFFNLHILPGENYTVYLRARSMASSLYLPLYLAPLKVFFNNSFIEDSLQAMYFGLILFIIIYNLFLFVILKQPEHFYFAAFIFFLGLVFSINTGYAIQYLWGNQTWLNHFSGIFSALVGIFIILFTSSLFKSKEETPRRYVWFLALIGIYILSITIDLLGAPLIAYSFLLYNTVFTFIFVMSISISSLRSGFKPAGYYILAWPFFLAGVLVYVLRDFDILSFNQYTAHAFQAGSTLTIVLISFTLGKKINIYIDKRDEAWNLAAKTTEENERLIQHQNQLLEERVDQRTRDLKQTVQSLQQQEEELKIANQFKDRVFSMISHDLKSPLSTLGGMLNVLQAGDLTKNEKNRILKNLRLSLNNTHDILDNILEWATRRHQHNKTSREFDLHHVVGEMIKLFSVQLETKSITLINQVQTGALIQTDKNMIQLVLRNLISNAIKFTGEGGTIKISLNTFESNYEICVEDTGIGMSKEDQGKLFSNKNHFTTRGTNNEKGTGLGLLLCKEFIEKNGGAIALSSQEGKGSTFSIKLAKKTPRHEEVLI